MKFTDIDLSRKLIKLGCKSESGVYFWVDEEGDWSLTTWKPVDSPHVIPAYCVPAFSLSDFLEGELGVENCKKIWPDLPIDYNGACQHCGGEIKIRNPKGFCDHLYYPTNCKTCLNKHCDIHSLRSAMIESADWVQYIRDAVMGKDF